MTSWSDCPRCDRVLAENIPAIWADQLAQLNQALRHVDLGGIPSDQMPVGPRGEHLSQRVEFLSERTDPVAGQLDSRRINGLIERALAAAEPDSTPVLLHADLIPGILVARADGQLVGLLDFGTLLSGYAAWDLAPAWWILDRAGRDRFRELLGVDAVSWAWGRAFAVTQGLLAHWYYAPRGHDLAPRGARAVEHALDD